jgi:hypothetical protein
MQKFPVQLMLGNRNAPPHPMGAGLAQGRYHHYEKKISSKQKVLCLRGLEGQPLAEKF